MSKILVTGGAIGLGAAIVAALKSDGHEVCCYDIADGNDVRVPNLFGIDELDVLINNAGVNVADWLGALNDDDWDRVMDVNAKGIFKMSKACLQMLIKSKGTILNIVSNASHMPMTCSLAYNASKGAAHIMTLQMARELSKAHGITVFGISPNKLAGTGMSSDIERQTQRTRGWTAEFARQYQLNALLTGEETPPHLLAEFVAFLLSTKARHKFLTGCVIPYGA